MHVQRLCAFFQITLTTCYEFLFHEDGSKLDVETLSCVNQTMLHRQLSTSARRRLVEITSWGTETRIRRQGDVTPLSWRQEFIFEWQSWSSIIRPSFDCVDSGCGLGRWWCRGNVPTDMIGKLSGFVNRSFGVEFHEATKMGTEHKYFSVFGIFSQISLLFNDSNSGWTYVDDNFACDEEDVHCSYT